MALSRSQFYALPIIRDQVEVRKHSVFPVPNILGSTIVEFAIKEESRAYSRYWSRQGKLVERVRNKCGSSLG